MNIAPRAVLMIVLCGSVSACDAVKPYAEAEPSLTVPNVLAHADEYVGKEIAVIGFVKVQFEDANIYGGADRKACLSLLIPKIKFEEYRRWNNEEAIVRGKLVSHACPDGSLCTWICNDKYGVQVEALEPAR